MEINILQDIQEEMFWIWKNWTKDLSLWNVSVAVLPRQVSYRCGMCQYSLNRGNVLLLHWNQTTSNFYCHGFQFKACSLQTLILCMQLWYFSCNSYVPMMEQSVILLWSVAVPCTSYEALHIVSSILPHVCHRLFFFFSYLRISRFCNMFQFVWGYSFQL